MKWGIFYNYFRDYDPITGRYVESDPIGLDGGLNTYGYVGGSPLGAVDPKGLYASILLRLPQILAEAAALGVGIYHEINDDESTSIPQSKPKDEQCDKDDCKHRLSDWEVKQKHKIDAHKLKHDILGKRAQVRLYELCLCKNGEISIRFKGCVGPTIRTGEFI